MERGVACIGSLTFVSRGVVTGGGGLLATALAVVLVVAGGGCVRGFGHDGGKVGTVHKLAQSLIIGTTRVQQK